MSEWAMRFDDDNKPFMEVEIKGQIRQLNWGNTFIFSHLFDVHIDHLFILEENEDEEIMDRGSCIFRQTVENFDRVMDLFVSNHFHHIHKPYPSDFDVQLYQRSELVPPNINDEIVELDEDEVVTREAMQNWDEEWRYYSGE